MWSRIGAILAALYIAAYAAEYADYLHHQGTWMADLGLNVLALPYVMVGRALTLDATFELHGFDPWGLVGALIFCAGFVYLAGLAVERLARRLLARSQRE